MKKAITTILIVFVIIIVGLIIKQVINNKFNDETEKIEFNYFVFKENEKYGVIDKDGNIILNPEYTDVIIPNPGKDVFLCENEKGSELINSKKESLFKEYDEIELIKLNNLTSTLSYEINALKYKKNGLYGLIDYKGNKITENIYESIENINPTEGKFIVKQNKKAGIIDFNGNILVPIQYDFIISDEYFTDKDEYNKSGFITLNVANDGYKYGYINYKGKKVLENKYNEINRIPNQEDEILLIVSENGQKALYNSSKKILEHEYASISYEEDSNLLIVQKNKKYGVFSLDGKKIIDINYDDIESKGIYLYAKMQSQNKVFDVQGKEIDMNFNKTIYKTENEDYKISIVLNNDITYYGVVNREDKTIIEERYRYLEYLYGKYFIVADESGNLGVIDSNNQVVLDLKYNSLQRIKGKNMVQAIEKDSKVVEVYSQNMNKIVSSKDASIHLEKEYIVVSINSDNKYFDNNGEEINDIKNFVKNDFPQEIGEYKKKQSAIEHIYYEK